MTDVAPAAQVLDGAALARRIVEALVPRVEHLAATGRRPGLGTVLVGDDPGSRSYVAGKHRDCARTGVVSIRRELPADASQADVLAVVQELNEDPACTAFLVQLPLPPAIDVHAVLEAIDPAKDADGLHPANLGRLVLNEPGALPCTPRGILALLHEHHVPVRGATVCVIGCGTTVGRPLGLMLTSPDEYATVTLCHEATVDTRAHARESDVIIAAAGVAHLVRPDWVRPGAVVVSVGLTRTVEGVLGDVDPGVAEVAGAWTRPVGGVGPMTRAMLLTNVVEAAERAAAR